MTLTADMLRAAFAGLPEEDGAQVAMRLRALLEAKIPESAIADLDHWGREVIIALRNGDYWTVECVSPEAFRMYPGQERNGVIVWANVWVRGTDMDIDELVKDINDVAYRTTKEEFANA